MTTEAFDIELSRIFNEHERQHTRAADQLSVDDIFRQKFRDMRGSILVPALDAIAASLATRGVQSKLVTEKEVPDDGSEPYIKLLLQVHPTKMDDSSFNRVTFGRLYPDSKYPFLLIQSDSRGERVALVRSTSAPGYNGTREEAGSVDLSEVSEELLQQKVLGILRDIYAGVRK